MVGKDVAWVDWLKAISIFLVVWGHMNGLNPVIKGFIYSVHLPAFLVVTGFLSAGGAVSSRFAPYLKTQIVYYVKLYALFSLLAILMWFLIEGRGQATSEVLRPLLGAVLGLHGPNLELVHNNDPLWYFPFLVTSLLWAFFLLRLGWIFGGVLGLVSFSPYIFNITLPLPWSLDLAPIGAFFILLGVWLRRLQTENAEVESAPVVFLVLALVGWVALVLWNGGANMNGRVWGRSFLFFLMAAVFGVWVGVKVFKNVVVPDFVRGIARHTLVIFCMHIYFTKAIGKLIFKIPEPYTQFLIFVMALVVTWFCWRVAIYVQPMILNFTKPRKV